MYPYQHSYETLALRSYNLDTIIKEMRTAIANGQVNHSDSRHIHGVRVLADKKSEVPTFAHPLIFEDRVYIDIRGLVAATSSDGEYRVTDRGEYDFRLIRAALELAWHNDEDFKDALVSASDLPLDLYTKWFSEGISYRLGLDPETQAKLAVLSGFFYLGCVEGQVNEKIWQRNIAMVSRVTRVPAARVIEWFPDQLYFDSVEGLTNYISGSMDNPRLRKMNPALLYGILANGWFTQHGNEVMSAALELPATWVSCVMYAFDNTSMGKSRVGKLLKRVSKGDRDKMFYRSILDLLR